jgi:hypothetical protein
MSVRTSLACGSTQHKKGEGDEYIQYIGPGNNVFPQEEGIDLCEPELYLPRVEYDH